LDDGFLVDFLTPIEYFEFVGGLYGYNADDVSEFIEKHHDFFGKDILSNKKYIRKLSKGNKSKVGVMAAILCKPEILILDEPFANLDPSSQIRLKNMLRELNAEHNTTLLISSHDLNHITEVCTRIVLLEEGEVIRDIKTSRETLVELEKYFAVNV
jgi:ABC-2 type transport system ATP-binding protein